uniref:Uncharacterized protein n=1 Tax=Arundo donax TaxID=35708 RepID=A0A0A9HLQ4_ARUDO
MQKHQCVTICKVQSMFISVALFAYL